MDYSGDNTQKELPKAPELKPLKPENPGTGDIGIVSLVIAMIVSAGAYLGIRKRK